MAGKDEFSTAGQAAEPSDAPPATLGVLGLQGHIDAIESGRVYGWAWNPEKASEHVSVDICFKGDVIGSVQADRFRQDLVDVKVGDGSHAFVFDLPNDARDADPASIAVYFTETNAPLSRGGHGRLPARDPASDPMSILSDRIDRIEASIQQMFRAMHIIRRSDDDTSRGAGIPEIEGLRKALAEVAQGLNSLADTVAQLETATNASHSFIERFDIEIHDRVTRDEDDELRVDIAKSKTVIRILFFVLVMSLGGTAFMLSLPYW